MAEHIDAPQRGADPGGADLPPSAIRATVRARALHAFIEGWPALDVEAASRLLSEMAARFQEPPQRQFGEAAGRGFYAALVDDDELAETFALIIQTRQAARHVVVPPPPAAFAQRADIGQPPRGQRLPEHVREIGQSLAGRAAEALRQVTGAWRPLFLPQTAPAVLGPGSSGGRLGHAETLTDVGWRVRRVAVPHDEPGTGFKVEVTITTAADDQPVVGATVLLALAGETEPRRAITDADGVADFQDVPMASIADASIQVTPAP